jgi:hypothetical protein
MKMNAIVCLALLALAPMVVAQEGARKSKTNAGLEKFKTLAGDWVSKAEGQETTINYKVTSGGTAVVETIGPGTPMEMITVITADGDGLALTHYCMVNNQPQMHAAGGQTGKSIAFKFVRATNMKSEKDMHMRNVTYTFVDKDTLKADWTNYTGGKESGKMTFTHKRKS